MLTAFFYIFSGALIVSALGVVCARSAVYSVLSLVSAMCMLAGLFALLKAYLVATIMVLVYAGAVLVLFLFVVMLVDFRKMSSDWRRGGLAPVLAGLLALVLCAQLFSAFPKVVESPTIVGSTAAIGNLLFTRYVLPFELTSFLLLAAVVSVVVLAKKDAK